MVSYKYRYVEKIYNLCEYLAAHVNSKHYSTSVKSTLIPSVDALSPVCWCAKSLKCDLQATHSNTWVLIGKALSFFMSGWLFKRISLTISNALPLMYSSLTSPYLQMVGCGVSGWDNGGEFGNTKVMSFIWTVLICHSRDTETNTRERESSNFCLTHSFLH